jgi:hypothetical protein
LKCANCGGKMTADMKFCGACGTPVEHTEPAAVDTVPDSPKDKADGTRLKKYIAPAAIVIAVVILAGIAWSIFKPSNYGKYVNTFRISQTGEQIIIQYPGKDKSATNGALGRVEYSLDGTKAAYLINDDADFSEKAGYNLYLIDKDQSMQIATDVYDMVISSSGEGVAFVQEVFGGVGKLSLYRKGETTAISDDFPVYGSLTISPDGRIVGYNALDDDGDMIGYYYDGKQKELGKDVSPVAIANGAKYVYYNKNSKLYVQRGDNIETRVSLGEYRYLIGFNKDLSQAIYITETDSGTRSYITRNGGEKERLSGELWNILLPHGTMWKHPILGIDSFANTYYQSFDDAVYRITDKFECTRIIREAEAPQLSSDGKTITYQRDDRIEKINGSKEDAEAVKLVEDEVRTYIAVEDGSAIYFVNHYDELYYQKGTNKPVLIGDGVQTHDGQSLVLYKGNKLFYVSDKELYVSTGSKGTRVAGIDGDVESVGMERFDVTVFTYDHNEACIYRSIDGINFDLVYQEQD